MQQNDQYNNNKEAFDFTLVFSTASGGVGTIIQW